MKQPVLCRPKAFRALKQAARRLETNEGLLQAALAISMHELEEVDPLGVGRVLENCAQRILSRTPSRQPRALLAHLHEVLFDEEGFCGNTHCFYDSHNSYLPCVLETKRGLPITLALVYKLVAEQIGLTVVGINSPGHFLACVCGADNMLVDPFFCGKVLTREEAFHRMEQTAGHAFPRDERFLRPTTHRQWTLRMLYNLHTAFAANGRQDDVAAMAELSSLLHESSG